MRTLLVSLARRARRVRTSVLGPAFRGRPVAAVAAAAGMLLSAAQALAADRPNILFVLTDDQHFALFDVMPNMQKLIVQEGASFTHAFFNDPLCCPSRASMMSGLYAHNHGVVSNNGKPFAEVDSRSVAPWLESAGYRTIIVGKYLNVFDGTPPGWDIFEVSRGAGALGHYYGPKLHLNGRVTKHPDTAYTTTVYTDRAIAHIKDAVEDGVPFFLWLSYHAPHVPPKPEPKYQAALATLRIPRLPSLNAMIRNGAAYTQRGPQSASDIDKLDGDYRTQARAALSIDDGIARLVATLTSEGVLNNTYIIVTTDNGWNPGYHRLSRAKGYPYDEVLKMPLFVRGPGVAKGSRIDALTINADMGPTMAGLAGARYSSTVDARSLADVLLGRARSTRQVQPIFYEEGTANRTTPSYRGLRSRKYLYVEYDTGEKELFDMDSDPYQLDNIYASASKTLKKALADRTRALAGCEGSECRSLEDKALN